MSRSKKLSMRRIRRYLKNKEGTAAIEFAILAIPFFMLLFAGQIRTGNFQDCGTQDNFKKLVCAKMSGLGNCEKRLRIDVATGNSFGSVTLPEPPEPPKPDPKDPNATVQIPNGEWVDTTAVIRGLYYHKLVLPPQLTRLESIEGRGIRLLNSTTAFKNEPFPAPGECPARI